MLVALKHNWCINDKWLKVSLLTLLTILLSPKKESFALPSTQTWADGHMAATEAWMKGRTCQHGFSSSSSPPGTLSDSCFWISDTKAKRNRSQEPGFSSSVKCLSTMHQEDEIPSLSSKKLHFLSLYLSGLGTPERQRTLVMGCLDAQYVQVYTPPAPPIHLYISAATLLSSGEPRGWGSLLRKLKEQTWHLNPLHISGVPYFSWCFLATNPRNPKEEGMRSLVMRCRVLEDCWKGKDNTVMLMDFFRDFYLHW